VNVDTAAPASVRLGTGKSAVCFWISLIEEVHAMRVKVYELQPSGGGHVLDKSRLHCIITIKEGKGSFKFLDSSREKLIRSTFDAPSSTFVAGGKMPDGTHWDALDTHPAWSREAIEAIVKHELYGFNLGATIDDDQ
jgi:hypothetical protein